MHFDTRVRRIAGFHGADYEECPVGLVRTDVSEERFAFIFRAERIGERGRALAVG
jgi:hypothetical protein